MRGRRQTVGTLGACIISRYVYTGMLVSAYYSRQNHLLASRDPLQVGRTRETVFVRRFGFPCLLMMTMKMPCELEIISCSTRSSLGVMSLSACRVYGYSCLLTRPEAELSPSPEANPKYKHHLTNASPLRHDLTIRTRPSIPSPLAILIDLFRLLIEDLMTHQGSLCQFAPQRLRVSA
jgi:hypothetical protein